MFLVCLKIIDPQKKPKTTVQIRANRNLNETIGRVLVTDVINSQAKFIRIKTVIGCFRIGRKESKSLNSFTKNKSKKNSIKGSSGMLMPELPTINFMEIGVQKATR